MYKNKIIRSIALCAVFFVALGARAQIGEHRNVFSIGGNAGMVMSNVGFTPEVSQGWHSGVTGGMSFRYTCEKYFSTICSVSAEVNYASIGWKQDILTVTDQPVINDNGSAESYSRTMNYIQIPVFAHLAWGREKRGFNFFVQAGPQIGVFVSESTSKNYDQPNLSTDGTGRANQTVAQESMPVENKFDYGIAAGLGMEYSHPKAGHILLEGRYYYGLGDIYGNSKKDYFGKSNHGNIVIKLTYLFDITK
jgi:hypothetical protein